MKIRLSKIKPQSALEWICVAVIGVVAIASLIGALATPVGLEWDALSYHLAAPKVWLREGRIGYIPFIHQSNFPFLLQMLYLLMLSTGSTAGREAMPLALLRPVGDERGGRSRVGISGLRKTAESSA